MKKRIRIFGRNTITLPTPLTIPSARSAFNGPSGITPFNQPENQPIIISSHCIGNLPNSNVEKNIINITMKKIGNPNSL
ncbi:hypothetical protein ES705_47127 [subsurface metagenome]